MTEPLVSVVIPFYSGIGWLEEAIRSVISQTYTNLEIFIINDGSNEDLTSIQKKYGRIINVINQENGGPSAARNKGIELAKGKYIAFLDSDDIWIPEKLSTQITFMEERQSAWSQHSYEMFWEKKNRRKVIDTSNYSGNVYKDCFISFKVQTSCVVVLKKILIENDIWFPIEMRHGQDTDFYRKIAKKFELGYVEGVFSKFRIRGNNAGFQAKVQLKDKALIWKSIKDDKEIVRMFPSAIVLAFKISKKFNNLIEIFQENILNNKNLVEVVAKLLYVSPYIIFKIYSRKLVSR